MTLTEAREALAAALSAVDGVTVAARPSAAAPQPGDGWVVLSRLAPSTFTACTATLTAVVTLGADEALAETLAETYAVALLDAATTGSLNPTDVSLEPQALVGGTGVIYALALTLTLEVD